MANALVKGNFPTCTPPGRNDLGDVFIAWTTVSNKVDADRLSTGVVEEGLAVCVQIDGPITSIYRWHNQIERTEEFRLTFKCNSGQLPRLSTYISEHHPYDTPEWIVVEAAHVGEKYLSWANSNSSNSTL